LSAWSFAGDLEFGSLLAKLIHHAVEMTGARHGAFGSLGLNGSFDRIVYAGESRNSVSAFRQLRPGLPAGSVVLVGSHLRVPVMVDGEVFGFLYVIEPAAGEFSTEDAEDVKALASAASLAIKNARRFEDALHRVRRTSARSELNAALIGAPAEDVFPIVARTVASIVPTPFVTIVCPQGRGNHFEVKAAVGQNATALLGAVYPATGTLAARAISTRAVAVSCGDHEIATARGAERYSCIAAFPLIGAHEVLGVIHAARQVGEADFTQSELDSVSEFAAEAGEAIELVSERLDHQREATAKDRNRIARELHDTVIQRLFATGLALQTLGAQYPQLGQTIERQIRQIDSAIVEIRTAVFGLAQVAPAMAVDLRRRVIHLIADLAPGLGVAPRITFSGPTEVLLPAGLAEDIVAVVTETLSNISRHASARSSEVIIDINDSAAEVVVNDDGAGIDPGIGHDSGTRNLAERARLRGGTFTVHSRADRGTRAAWTVPLGMGAAS
jgi:signal transduction histidine kinase